MTTARARTPLMKIGSEERRTATLNVAAERLLGEDGERFVALVRRPDGSLALRPLSIAGVVDVVKIRPASKMHGGMARVPAGSREFRKALPAGAFAPRWDDEAEEAVVERAERRADLG